MQPDHKILTESEWYRAHRVVAAWKNDPKAAHACPRCAAPGVKVTDHSLRPYAEWYQLNCAKCDLEVTMHLPLAPTPGAPV